MALVRSGTIPITSLLYEYETVKGGYCDCYVVDTQGDANLQNYISVFFGTWIFKLELKLLSLFGLNRDRPDQVTQLAEGCVKTFAAWEVEGRTEDDLLLAVGTGPIRTWLQIEARSKKSVRLYFGSALLPLSTDRNEHPRLDAISMVLLPFHKLYSRILPRAAVRKCNQT